MAKYPKDQRANEPQSLATMLAEVLRKGNMDQKVNETRVLDFINGTFSPSVLLNIQKMYVQQGVLVMIITSPSLRQEFHLTRERLMAQISRHVGAGIIKEIRLLGA
jgi:hypothetical protein